MPEKWVTLVVRRPWMVASVLSALAHLPFFVVGPPREDAPPPEVVIIELATSSPGPGPSADGFPSDPPVPSGPRTSTATPSASSATSASSAATAREGPEALSPPDEPVEPISAPTPVSDEEAPVLSAHPAVEDASAIALASEGGAAEPEASGRGGTGSGRGDENGNGNGSESESGGGAGLLGAGGQGGTSRTPSSTAPFDPRAYRGLAFAHVERHKRYPRKARVLGQQGEVVLLIALDLEGRLVREPRVQRSSGVEVLDEEAVRMVKAAVPFPKPEGEVARAPILVPLTIRFRLEDP